MPAPCRRIPPLDLPARTFAWSNHSPYPTSPHACAICCGGGDGSGAGGDPADDRFNPEAQLEAVAELASLGITWSGVGVPGDSLDHAVETLQRFGESVIG